MYHKPGVYLKLHDLSCTVGSAVPSKRKVYPVSSLFQGVLLRSCWCSESGTYYKADGQDLAALNGLEHTVFIEHEACVVGRI